jgi:hypothetical protein
MDYNQPEPQNDLGGGTLASDQGCRASDDTILTAHPTAPTRPMLQKRQKVLAKAPPGRILDPKQMFFR